jgi:four helix bundle protein
LDWGHANDYLLAAADCADADEAAGTLRFQKNEAIKNSKFKMKNAQSNLCVPGKIPPRDIVERTFAFAVQVIQLCGKMDARPGVGRVMMSQILRAGTSVPSNVEEAQAAQSRPDFVSKMSIALKEARETHLRLRLLATANIFPNNQLQPLVQEADEIKRVIGAIVVSAKRSGTA